MNAQPYLERMTQAMRLKHLALKTEEAYVGKWADAAGRKAPKRKGNV